MSVAQMNDLRSRILGILRDRKEPLSIPQIEHELKLRDDWTSDTFDVRDVVHALIYDRTAEHIHPGRLVAIR